MAGNPKLLYVTDLHYPAKARVYRDEDIYITSQLAADFDIAVCHPLAAENLVDAFDIVVFRNTGPVLHYRDAYASFVRHALQSETTVYNTLTGKADMVGKQYLVELSRDGHPVIPTIDDRDEFARLPDADSYVVKPKLGSDSIGMEFVTKADLDNVVLDDMLIQPRIIFSTRSRSTSSITTITTRCLRVRASAGTLSRSRRARPISRSPDGSSSGTTSITASSASMPVALLPVSCC